MNLSPSWVVVFQREGWEALHWSEVGSATAADIEILQWAAESESVVFTHDLDFGALLASSMRRKPSAFFSPHRASDVETGQTGGQSGICEAGSRD